MKTATKETRTIIINAYISNMATRKQLATIFGYHIQSINNWIREYKQEGRLEARPNGHRKSVFTPEEKKKLIELLEQNVDLTLVEIKDIFKKECTLWAISKLIRKLGFTYKKNATGKRTRQGRYYQKTS